MIKCVPTEDGLAKAVEFGPACLNEKQPGEEWVSFMRIDYNNMKDQRINWIIQIEDNFVKACVLDTWTNKYSRAIVQTKACVFQNETIPVDTERTDLVSTPNIEIFF